MHWVILLGLACTLIVQAQRNAQEEAICAPFLTSRATSPLIPNLKRNLTHDEDGEFACELVLQDKFLPSQIRLTVHEGLYYLAMRHLEMGEQRQQTALRHAKILAEMVPSNFIFQYFAGMWSLNPEVFELAEAEQYFYEALYGKGSKTHRDSQNPLTPALKYNIFRSYIRSLSYQYKYDLLYQEMIKFLTEFPYDLEIFFYLNELQKKFPQLVTETSQHEYETATKRAKELLSLLKEVGYYSMEYTGFVPPKHGNEQQSDWQVDRLTSLPSKETFDSYIQQRKPFVISLGSVDSIDQTLHWKVSQWFREVPSSNKNKTKKTKKNETANSSSSSSSSSSTSTTEYSPYFLRHIAPQSVLVEKALKTLSSVHPVSPTSTEKIQEFGLGMSVHRQILPLTDIIRQHFQDKEHYYYVNIQAPNHTNTYPYYNQPLYALRQDVPVTAVSVQDTPTVSKDTLTMSPDTPTVSTDTPSVSQAFFEVFNKNLTSITLWMGDTTSVHTLSEDSTTLSEVQDTIPDMIPDNIQTRSRLHRDALDNLYIVLQGQKTFRVYNPTLGQSLDTISPTYAINRDGLSYQWDINTFLTSLTEQFPTLQSLSSLPTRHTELLLSLLGQREIVYDLENVHFSTLQQPVTPASDATVELQAGDIFYLPTGWFHEVSSYAGAHTAINLWWKPLHWQQAVVQEAQVQQAMHRALYEAFLPATKDGDHIEL